MIYLCVLSDQKHTGKGKGVPRAIANLLSFCGVKTAITNLFAGAISGFWVFKIPDVGDERLNKRRLESQSRRFCGQTRLARLLISSKLVQIDGFSLQPRGMAPGSISHKALRRSKQPTEARQLSKVYAEVENPQICIQKTDNREQKK